MRILIVSPMQKESTFLLQGLAGRGFQAEDAVAWEGAGGARACKFSGVPFLEIRGITDAADHSAASDFEKNLEVAMYNIALLIVSFSGHMRDV